MIKLVARLFGGVVGRLSPLGPIFAKELRVSARQRRSYLLRSGYLGLLTIFVVLFWLSVVRFETSREAAYLVSRMSEVGKAVVAGIICFQFVAAQLVAVVIMSTAISEEIHRGTLGVLMTTPLTCLQIVAGKLFSRLLQVLVLLAISFPLLAIVRVFGGVPWHYVVAGLAVTITASIFAGAVTMLFSVRFRQAHSAVLGSLGALLAFYGLLPLALVLSCLGWFLVYFFNGFFVLGVITWNMVRPGGGSATGWLLCPLHCLLMLGGSAGVLCVCARMLRRAARQQLAGQPPPSEPGPPTLAWAAAAAPVLPIPGPLPVQGADSGPLRPVVGSPVLWRELARPVLGHPRARAAILAAGGAVLALTYMFMLPFRGLDKGRVQVFFVLLYLFGGMLWTVFLSAMTVTPEKESRCWPLLLTTPLGEGHILLGKLLGVLRRSWPAWAVLAGHLVLFAAVGILHPVVLLHVGLLVGGVVPFLLGLGAYFSARLRRTSSAVLASLGVPLLLWGVLPAGLDMIAEAAQAYQNQWLELPAHASPVFQAVTVTVGATARLHEPNTWETLRYGWFGGSAGCGLTTAAMLAFSAAYAAAGCLLAWLTKRGLRRHVF